MKALLLFGAVACTVSLLGLTSAYGSEPGKPKKGAESCVEGSYKVVERRGTALWIVLVAASCRNEKSMRALGEKLKVDLAGESLAIVEIYDNPRAAKMSAVMESKPSSGSKDDEFYSSV